MMQAVQITQTNSLWEIRQIPIPEPKEGQVLIKIHASGLCGTDLHVHHGLMPVQLPCTPGHEPAGEIVKRGPGVIDFNVGDRVGVSWIQRGCGRCTTCQSKEPLYCPHSQTWKDLGGGMAEYMLAWADGCTLLPEDLSYIEAAPLFCAGYTIASGFHNGHPRPGDIVAVSGVGGLGHLAIQYAKAKGHRVIAITGHSEKKQVAKELGADLVVVPGDNMLSEIASFGGIDILLHTGNASDRITALLGAMNPEGRVVIMGIAETPLIAHPFQLIHHQVSIIGSMQYKRSYLVDILNLTAAQKIRPMIEVYSLDQLPDVVERLQSGRVRFRAVVSFR